MQCHAMVHVPRSCRPSSPSDGSRAHIPMTMFLYNHPIVFELQPFPLCISVIPFGACCHLVFSSSTTFFLCMCHRRMARPAQMMMQA